MSGYEFYKVVNIYKDVEKINENGETYIEEKLIKKNVKLKWHCSNLDDITDYEETIDYETGRKRRAYTTVNHKNKGQLIIKMPYNNFNELYNKTKNITINGFKSKW